MKKLILSLTFLLSCLLPAYVRGKEPITQEQAIEIAQQELMNRYEDYKEEENTIKVFFGDECDCWSVFITSKQFPLRIGATLEVQVSADGSSVRLIPGL